MSGQGIVSAVVTLTSGGEPTNDGDADNNSNLTIDFGVFQPASLGSIVWFDTDRDGVRDAGEVGVQSVRVTLYDAAGNPVATALTDSTGYFQFVNLAPGTYSVGFSNLPPGHTFTQMNQGDDASDSDVNPATGFTAQITLVPGQNNPTLFAGIVEIAPTAITLASFTATRDGDSVVVRWSTTSEVNTWGFDLYRSADGQRASAVKVTPELIPGKGRGLNGASYSWTDKDAKGGEPTPTGWSRPRSAARPTSTARRRRSRSPAPRGPRSLYRWSCARDRGSGVRGQAFLSKRHHTDTGPGIAARPCVS